MSTIFEASNGVKVIPHDTSTGVRLSVRDENPVDVPGFGPTIRRDSVESYLDPRQADALREFYDFESAERWQAKHDAELGRWRSYLDPTWTAVLDPDTEYVEFRNDDGLRQFSILPGSPSTFTPWDGQLRAIGREYVEAHPKRKPWEDATPGQVWDVDLPSGGVRAVTVYSAKHEEPVTVFRDAYTQVEIETDDTSILDARRVYPEDAS